MRAQIDSHSPDPGLGFVLLYQKAPLQTFTILVQNASLSDLLQVKTRLDQLHKSAENHTFNLQQINPNNQTQEKILQRFHQCQQILQKFIQTKRSQQPVSQPHIIIVPQSRLRTVFSIFRLLVVGVLVILFTISLFSSNDWEKSDLEMQEDSEKSYQNNPTPYKKENQEHEISINPQIEKEKVKQKQKSKKTAKIERQKNQREAQKEKQRIQQEENLIKSEKFSKNSNTLQPTQEELHEPIQGSTKNQNPQKIEFSSIKQIHIPLEYIYNFLSLYIPANVAYLICAYVLWPIAWILTIAFAFI